MSTEKAMEVLETGLATEPEHAGQTPGPAPEPEKAASRRAYADEFYNQGGRRYYRIWVRTPGISCASWIP